MICEHRFNLWAASFLYWGMLGSRRQCSHCGRIEQAILGGYSDRRERIAEYLTRRLRRCAS
jgi:hypothetical protein